VRELLVLLEHLRSVAARAAVDPVARVAAALAATIAATAAPAILISILVQRNFASYIKNI
jgi:hypothetical protein